MFEVRQITDKDSWEDFVISQKYTLFVQSWLHGEFYTEMGEKFWVFGVYAKDESGNEELAGGSLVLSTHARRGDYLYLPYGPIIKKEYDSDYEKIAAELMKHLRDFAGKNDYSFIRVSPFIEDNQKNRGVYKKIGFRSSPIHALAENTWLLNITMSEEEILAGMKKNHRNLINRCRREGVKIELSDSANDLTDFNKIHDETAKRHSFHRFPDKYVENEFKVFANKNKALILKAYLPDGRLDSTAIFMYYGTMSVYRHSGSLNLDKKLPTSYLLQWHAIEEAKNRGMKFHNFWGIAPDNAPKSHPFKGITHFKKGFGGYGINLLHCQDLVVSNKYWFNWVIETARRIKRGF